MKALNLADYTPSLRREVEKQLNKTNSFIEDNIGGYVDSSSTIVISLDEILALFYACVSLLKAYISTVKLHDNRIMSYTEHQTCMKTLCSNTMISTIQEVYSNSASSYMSPQDLAMIVSLYKKNND